MKKYFLQRIVLLQIVLSCYTLHSQIKQPVAPVRIVTDTYFGTNINDPYRWLEDIHSPESAQWIKAQAEYADDYLENLPLHDSILAELSHLNDTGIKLYWVKKRGSRYFYVKKKPKGNNIEIFCMDGLDKNERLLASTEDSTEKGKQAAIITYTPSPDGKFIAYLASEGGAEFGDIHIVDVSTGTELPEIIEHTRWDSGNWTADSKAFTYLKFETGVPESETLLKIKSYIHVIGSRTLDDKPLFGFGLNPAIALDPALSPAVFFGYSGKYAVAMANDGISKESQFYLAETRNMNNRIVPWQQVAALEDKISEMTEFNGYLYMITFKNAPRYKIMRVPVEKPDIANAELVYESTNGIVKRMAFAKDALYADVSEGGLWKVHRIDYQSLRAAPVTLPNEGSQYVRDAFPDRDGVLMGVDSWTESNLVLVYDPHTGLAKDTRILRRLTVDMSDIKVENVNVFHDGVQIPMVLLYRKNLIRDGKNPVLLNTYGSYGSETTPPRYYQQGLPWLRRGGILAFAGVRGGGEYGEEWHKAAYHETKPNSWKDFIACAKYLIAEKYTSPAHLGIEGTSAGGIVMSNSIAEQPDLFGAAVINVGLSNMLRAETTANGRANIQEFGTIKDEQGFRDVYAIDGYHKIKQGVRYPAVLLTHGINDPRVAPWMSAKMAARLQAALPDHKSVLLRVDYNAGHGHGSSELQQNKQLADIYAFLWQELAKK